MNKRMLIIKGSALTLLLVSFIILGTLPKHKDTTPKEDKITLDSLKASNRDKMTQLMIRMNDYELRKRNN